MEKLRMGTYKDYVHGLICITMGMSLASLISSLTGFISLWFIIIFGSLFGLTLIYKTYEMWSNMFVKKKRRGNYTPINSSVVLTDGEIDLKTLSKINMYNK